VNIRTTFDELSQGTIGSYERYNGFYRRANMRKVIYELYDGKCAATGQPINLDEADIGHIVPRSRGDIFEHLYPGLDVDNAINLHLLASWVNKRNNDAFMPAPLVIHNSVSFAASLVSTKMENVLRYADGVDVSPLRQTIPSTDTAALADLELYDDLLALMSTAGGKYLFASDQHSSLSGGEGYERLQSMVHRSDQGSVGCLDLVQGECVQLDEHEVPKGTRISSVYREAVANSATGLLFRRDQLLPVKDHIESKVIPFYQARYMAGSAPVVGMPT
jgi:hypothetical protein